MRMEQWLYKIRHLIRSLVQRQQVEHELDEELRYHFERQVEEHMARGMTAEQARKAAKRGLGNVETRKEECRDSWIVAPLDRLARDTRLACRTLGRDVGFTIGVLLLLALGIGANVAMFSIVDSILLEPLPYREPDRLVVVREGVPDGGNATGAVNARHFLEWQRECDCFEDLALAEWIAEVNLAGEGDPERVPSLRVTPNMFSLLGVSAEIGRTFAPDDAVPGENAPAPIVISHGLWQRRFGRDPNALGKTLSLDGVSSVVVGVLPSGFRPDTNGPDARADVYRPWDLGAHTAVPWRGWNNDYSYSAVGRLRDGASAEATLEQLDALQAAIAAEHFGESDSRGLEAVLIPLHEWVTGTSRQGLLLLLAAVGAALLVACLNIANLMLVRATARSREAGVRAALGASRLAIFRGVIVESALLSCGGAAAGIGIAIGGLEMFERIAGAGLPRAGEVQMDGTALLAALALAIISTLAFGLLPALKLTRVDPQKALRTSSRAFTETAERVRLRHALVSAEVGFSTLLLIVGGLLLVSFVRLDSVDRGFNPTSLLTAGIGLPFTRYPENADRLAVYEEILDGLRGRPGIVAAGVTTRLPLTGSAWGSTAIAEGTNPVAAERPQVQYRFVSPGYLEAMGLTLLTGRALDERDYARPVAIVSERAANVVWPSVDPLGRRFHMGDPENLQEVVGLVPDVLTDGFTTDPPPIVYMSLTGQGFVQPSVSIAVRTDGDPLVAVGALRDAIQSIDADLPISNVRTMQQIESASLGERRFQLTLIAGFGAAALLIAALGTYSVLAYGVKIRAHDIAVRIALGAQPGSVLAMVLRQGLQPALVGLGLGIAAALILGRFLSSQLYSVTPTDVPTLIAVAAVMLVAALLAALLPARRAARTRLQDALRYE
jgi:predicted permease